MMTRIFRRIGARIFLSAVMLYFASGFMLETIRKYPVEQAKSSHSNEQRIPIGTI